MRAKWMLAVGLIAAGWSMPSYAEKSESDCLDITQKYINALGGLLREAKPKGRCALAEFGKKRHEELLREYNTEPEECRKTDLGKNLEKTLKVRVSQESRLAKKYCRR